MESNAPQSNASICWHLNVNFKGKTNGLHETEASPHPGTYTLTPVDDNGGMHNAELE